jgi:hypothetical protein
VWCLYWLSLQQCNKWTSISVKYAEWQRTHSKNKCVLFGPDYTFQCSFTLLRTFSSLLKLECYVSVFVGIWSMTLIITWSTCNPFWFTAPRFLHSNNVISKSWQSWSVIILLRHKTEGNRLSFLLTGGSWYFPREKRDVEPSQLVSPPDRDRFRSRTVSPSPLTGAKNRTPVVQPVA